MREFQTHSYQSQASISPRSGVTYSYRQWNTIFFHYVRALNTQHRERNIIVSITGMPASTQSVHRSYEPCRVRVGEYVNFHRQGDLLVQSLVRREDVQEPINHMDNVLAHRGPIPGSAVPSFGVSPRRRSSRMAARSHAASGAAVHRRFLPHGEPDFGTPRVASQPLNTGIAHVWRQADVNDARSYLNDDPLCIPRRRTTRQTPVRGCSNGEGQVEPSHFMLR